MLCYFIIITMSAFTSVQISSRIECHKDIIRRYFLQKERIGWSCIDFDYGNDDMTNDEYDAFADSISKGLYDISLSKVIGRMVLFGGQISFETITYTTINQVPCIISILDMNIPEIVPKPEKGYMVNVSINSKQHDETVPRLIENLFKTESSFWIV